MSFHTKVSNGGLYWKLMFENSSGKHKIGSDSLKLFIIKSLFWRIQLSSEYIQSSVCFCCSMRHQGDYGIPCRSAYMHTCTHILIHILWHMRSTIYMTTIQFKVSLRVKKTREQTVRKPPSPRVPRQTDRLKWIPGEKGEENRSDDHTTRW